MFAWQMLTTYKFDAFFQELFFFYVGEFVLDHMEFLNEMNNFEMHCIVIRWNALKCDDIQWNDGQFEWVSRWKKMIY